MRLVWLGGQNVDMEMVERTGIQGGTELLVDFDAMPGQRRLVLSDDDDESDASDSEFDSDL
jgi:hypothetical protein